MPEMTGRERYRAVMHFEPGVRTLLWEFAYWVATVERWYQEGLRRTSFSPPPGLPAGAGVFGEGLAFPIQRLTRYRDIDVHNQLGFDDGGVVQIPLNWRHSPSFRETILEEDETTYLMINADGVKVRARKQTDSPPQYLSWPVHDRASWEQIEEERFGPDIMPRFPARWETLALTYRDRDYPLGVIMDGFFSTPRELLGVERQLMMYYDDPQLMHAIANHLSHLWLAMLEEVVSEVELDFVYIWEDMAFKNGPFVSPHMFEEFIVPYYQRVTGFLKAHEVDIIFVDTDGDCRLLISGFLKAGVTGLYPFEVQAGMDIVEVRKRYPQLLIQGGLDKLKVARDKEAIDAELEAKLPFMLSQGGYIPYCDHLVPPEVSWENFCYYRERVRQYVERYQPQ
jgi:uroporphyrinogen-III decarboxylase